MRPTRGTAALAALMTSAALLLSGTATAAAPPPPPAAPPGGASATAHTAGRVVEAADGSLAFSWPGVYFEGRFRGTGVGVVLDDPAGDYDIAVDGKTVDTIATPGKTTYRVDGLPDGGHSVRVVKRNESPWATGSFGGFVAAPGGRILPKPPARHRQIEFIGDSFTAGYGNESVSRDCTSEQVNRTTNADLGFGALTAQSLDADYQVNAFSGRGMVRNYNGSEPGSSYRTYYDRALLADGSNVWKRPPSWRPQLVVIGLGINDFSTAINPGEEWTDESRRAAYVSAYHGFLDKLRAQYGPATTIVVTGTYMSNTTAMADLTKQIVAARNAKGDKNVRYWYYGEGLDYGGCHWHPSLHDHQVVAEQLKDFIGGLRVRW